MTGHEPADEPAPKYVGEHVRQAIATDPRTTEQGIGVRVVGDQIFLSGEVGSGDRRDAIGQVAAEVAPDHRICNEVAVTSAGDQHTTERLS
jgi:hypothetical protein